MDESDGLLEAIERTYRAARTDAMTGEVLPVDVALRKLIDQVCATFDIPEAVLYTDDPLEWARIIGVKLAIPPEDLGELSNVNRMSHETEERVYRRQFFEE